VEGLRRRHTVGGSWHARLSLARTACWLDSLGRTGASDPAELDYPTDLVSTMDSAFGRLEYLRPPGGIEGYQPRWTTPPRLPGADAAAWAVGASAVDAR
jgi:hypothetical protein